MRCNSLTIALAGLVLAGGADLAQKVEAVDHVVSTRTEFQNALDSATSGDQILLAPGTYAGGLLATDLTGVTIRSQDPNNQAIISGGSDGLKLKGPMNVTISDLKIDNTTDNGLNIDDTGSLGTAQNVTLRNLTITNIGVQPGKQGGIHIPIKLSGLDNFLIQRVRLTNWSTGGEGIDPVGSHHGVIENSIFDNSASTGTGSGTGVRAKGGSQDIVIRANRFVEASGRPVEFGGQTGAAFFRFLPGESGFEVKDIRATGNVIVGSASPVAFVNTDGDQNVVGGNFHHNLVYQPRNWVARILNENGKKPSIAQTQDGVFEDNVIIYDRSQLNSDINVGGNTQSSTFTFARNTWYDPTDPANSEPRLPYNDAGNKDDASQVETDGVYGTDPGLNLDGIVPWQFDFGVWLVNANDADNSIQLTTQQMQDLVLAVPGPDAELDLLSENPLIGDYTFEDLTSQNFQLDALSYAVLVERSLVPEPSSLRLLLFGSLALVHRRPRCGRLNWATKRLNWL